MYNRYIPQADGTYQRSRVPDPCRKQATAPQPRQEPAPPKKENCQQEAPRPGPGPQPRCGGRSPRYTQRSFRKEPGPNNQEGSVLGFLRQLLPRDFDTADLLVVLLLLLMSGDQTEDQNTALLTLALYLFM